MAASRLFKKLADLLDVLIGTPANRDVLVYNSATEQYEIRSLSIADVANLEGAIDAKASLGGATFTGAIAANPSADIVPVLVKEYAGGQTANLIEINTVAGSNGDLFRIDRNGNAYSPSFNADGFNNRAQNVCSINLFGFDGQTANFVEISSYGTYAGNLFKVDATGNVTSSGFVNAQGVNADIYDSAAVAQPQYPPAQNETYVKATSNFSGATFAPYNATDPSNSLTGNWDGNAWLTYTFTTNQRFHIDLGVARVITKIYYENAHVSGVLTDTGVKNFTLWGSNDAAAFAELTYGVDTNWTQLTCSQSLFIQHVNANSADPQYVTVTNTTAYRYYAFKFADNWGNADYMAVRRIELQATVPYLSVAAAERQLIAADGTTVVLDWATAGALTVIGDLHATALKVAGATPDGTYTCGTGSITIANGVITDIA